MTFLRKHYKKFWFALALNVLVFLVMQLLMRTIYGSNDESTMSLFIDGSRGIRDVHLLFENFILGYLYRILYHFLSFIPWYAVLQQLMLIFSFSSITYVLLNRKKGSTVSILIALLLLFFAKECYIHIQFTKTAGVLAGASALLLFHGSYRRKLSIPCLIGGLLLGGFGMMYRDMEFLVCLALLSAIGIFLLLTRESAEGMKKSTILHYLFSFGGLFLLIGLLYFGNRLYYSQDSEWADYKHYNYLRAMLMDTGFPDYDEYKEVYQELDINRTAYKLYSKWNYYDPDKFTVEVMERLVALKESRQAFSLQTFGTFLKTVPVRFFENDTFYCFLLLFLLWLVTTRKKAAGILAVLYSLVVFLAIYYYLYCLGRYLQNRVDVGLWFSLSLLMLWMIQPEYTFRPQLCLSIILSLTLLVQYEWHDDWRINTTKTVSSWNKYKDILQLLSQDKEHLYIVKVGILTPFKCYGPYETAPVATWDNITWLGGWDANVASAKWVMSKYGVENPYRDLIDNEDVYLVDTDIDTTISYLQKYYNKDAEAEEMMNLSIAKVYRITTK